MISLALGIYTQLLYRPVYNLVIFFYNQTPGVHNFGVAMIGLAIFIRFLFIIFTIRGLKNDDTLKELEPLVANIEKDDYTPAREKRAKIIDLIRSKGINPYSEIYALLAQLGFLAVLYQVIQIGLGTEGFSYLYSFVNHPGHINSMFFGIDVVHSNALLSAGAAGLLFIEQVWEYSEKKELPTAFSERWFPLLLAIVTFILLVILPSAKSVFIATSVVFSLVLKAIVRLARRKPKFIVAEGHA